MHRQRNTQPGATLPVHLEELPNMTKFIDNDGWSSTRLSVALPVHLEELPPLKEKKRLCRDTLNKRTKVSLHSLSFPF